MGLHLDERTDGSYSLFIDGDLQFDTRDEALYHEALALPALCLARPMVPGEGLRVLICGGGDGLALRECLRFPGVAQIDLVDYDPNVVELGRLRFAEQNRDAFHDPRVTVYLEDAWEFLKRGDLYDVVLLDFTVPRRPEEARIFTWEWYAQIRDVLAPEGVLGLNGVSPQMTPEAFWCLHNTVRATGLNVLPYRCCIPSFRHEGYGVWAFMLAARRPMPRAVLRHLRCPVPTLLTDFTGLWRGARFTRQEREAGLHAPIHTLENPCYLSLLLNPGLAPETAMEDATAWPDPYNLDPLLRMIPISHPYHTREMIETLAGQVVGSVRSLDLPRLVDALLERASALTEDIVEELHRLRDFLRSRLPSFDFFRRWATRVFAILVVFMTLVNAIAPDNAFAKGSAGLGHASMSRGYTGGYRSTSSSFGGQRSVGGSLGTRSGSSFGSSTSSVGRTGSFGRTSSIRSVGFRRSYGRGQATDIYGNAYTTRVYVYCGSGYGHGHYYHVPTVHHGGGHSAPTPTPEQHQALFVADEDMLVMDNGDVILTLSDSAYLLVNNGTVALFHQKLPDPLIALYPDPQLFQSIKQQIADQKAMAEHEISLREDWLAWAGWTSALFPTVKADKSEVASLRDLLRRLDTAQQRLGEAPQNAAPKDLPPGAVELFAGAFLLPDKRVMLRRPDGLWNYADSKTVTTENPADKPLEAPPELADALKTIITKLEKELVADLSADDNYLRELTTDMRSLQKDLSEYNGLAAIYGTGYYVDYGTDEIVCSDALNRTNQDIASVQQEYQTTLTSRQKTAQEMETIQRAWFNNISYTAPPLPSDIQLLSVPNTTFP